MIRPSKGYFTV